ncbi:hypothetical protein TKWG_24515 [Advenella kashmirensis WT001]|uniref:Type II toxin-antitoxin system RelE/ParE family toxin n=1 Tax=Advenella kashmirensis (strain DSM 17095 / LMG 22695 / WT001) TaxID=1036672 RepID=I3UHH0_ADVKW|nr:type II toxin-antitoxin system RelE/ParE family toxin [Advenella kashmirensis]AFK64458.1 hypothetical protein TKWG_24515 [Advenella kashmirensis WT001]
MAQTARYTIRLTAHFERNLEQIEAFLLETEAPQTFDALLDELTDTIIPNLARFPHMGRVFSARPARSVEVANGIERLSAQFDVIANSGDQLREYVMSNYLLLYATINTTVYLLSIRHQRQLSFDFANHWPS